VSKKPVIIKFVHHLEWAWDGIHVYIFFKGLYCFTTQASSLLAVSYRH